MASSPRLRYLSGGGNWYSGNPGVAVVNFDPTLSANHSLIVGVPDGTLLIQNSVLDENCESECAVGLFLKVCSTCDTGSVVPIALGVSENTVSVNGLARLTQTVSRTGDTWTDGGGTSGTLVLDGTIPAGSIVLATHYTDVTGFTGDVSAALLTGDGSDADRYMTGTPSVFATASVVPAGVPSGTAYHASAVSTVTLTLTSGSDFGLVTAGQVTVSILYLSPLY